MSSAFIEDQWAAEERSGDPWQGARRGRSAPAAPRPAATSGTSRLDSYNAQRRQRGYRVLTLEEYQQRCGWLETYRETGRLDRPEEQAAAIARLKAQDQPPPEKFDDMARSPLLPMPERLRVQIERLFGKGRTYDVPRREWR